MHNILFCFLKHFFKLLRPKITKLGQHR